MVKITDLKAGDMVKVVHDGVEKEGEVVEISREEGMACIDNGVQEFWYTAEEIMPIPLNEEQLLKLGFQSEPIEDGGVKYLKGPFRIVTMESGNFSNLEVWYREDRRHFHKLLYVHELQNHHLDMTKVPLDMP
ncbi:MAG: hypothetical protein ABR502_02725 [Chitinophagaceae bacterium]